MWFEYYVNELGQLGWRLHGQHGRVVAESVASYGTRQDCLRDLNLIQAGAGNALIVEGAPLPGRSVAERTGRPAADHSRA